jgi:hypothetical protein
MEDVMQTSEQPKISRYLEAGSPVSCHLASCRKSFLGTCIHANDGHFYCSHGCAAEGEKKRPSAKIQQFKARRT